jgi:DNA polymerase
VNDEGQISYMGQNQYTRQWSRLTTYGGKLLENICQAISRDVLFYRLPDLEEARYDVRVKIHDEVVTYAPDGLLYGPKGLSKLLAKPHTWAPGLPLAAAGFEGYRYRKD